MSEDRIRVPWVVGTEILARPQSAREPEDPRARCARKRAQIEQSIAWLVRRCARYPEGSHGRAVLEGQLDLQRRRLGWLNAAEAATPAERAERRKVIEAELGTDGLEFFANGLPAERVGDQRFEYGLCELALVRFVQGV